MARWNILNSSDDTVDSPASRGEAITPSNTVPLTDFSRAIYVGGAGDITCQLVDDTDDTVLVAVPAGTVLPIRVKMVKATGTTATNLVALY